MSRDRFRGSGRTTRQMLEAPQGAVYVWPLAETARYALLLAEHLGRTDLRIIGASQLTPNYLHGRTTPLVIDHAAHWFLTATQRELLRLRGLLN